MDMFLRRCVEFAKKCMTNGRWTGIGRWRILPSLNCACWCAAHPRFHHVPLPLFQLALALNQRVGYRGTLPSAWLCTKLLTGNSSSSSSAQVGPVRRVPRGHSGNSAFLDGFAMLATVSMVSTQPRQHPLVRWNWLTMWSHPGDHWKVLLATARRFDPGDFL